MRKKTGTEKMKIRKTRPKKQKVESIEEFYRWYANLPLSEREQQIGTFAEYEYPFPLTLSSVYKRLTELGNITRPYDIERQKLLQKVEWCIHEKIIKP